MHFPQLLYYLFLIGASPLFVEVLPKFRLDLADLALEIVNGLFLLAHREEPLLGWVEH